MTEQTNQSAYQEEERKLQDTTGLLSKELERLSSIPRYFGQDLTEQALDFMREQTIYALKTAVPEPYFGRLDYRSSGQKEHGPLYIGKRGAEHPETGRPLIIDWRAPIASLFYAFSGGDDEVSYEAPEGEMRGYIDRKRNLAIRSGSLQRVVDAYVRGQEDPSVTDEFLLYRLGEAKDNRLRDIVSTIQAEQDRIIRAPKSAAFVIQGVAGSGKTTVALHRLAYLLYRYRETMRAERMIIFAPSRMFLDYISGVLPELGVGDIQQTTFADWVMDMVQEEIKPADPSERLKRRFAVGIGEERRELDEILLYKGSLAFLHYIEDFLAGYESSYAPAAPFSPWEGAREVKKEAIREWWFTEYRHEPLMKRRERIVARLKRDIDMQLRDVRDPKRAKELKKQASQRLKTYLSKLPEDTPLTLYLKLLGPKAGGDSNAFPAVPGPLRQLSEPELKKLRKGIVQPEDFAPLAFLHDRLYGVESSRMFDHVVVDEAQDYSPFQISLLQLHAKSSSFTILGDLSQAIHGAQGIEDWSRFLELFDEESRSYAELVRSYRSTTEIIQFANRVIAHGKTGVEPAVPVFRSGEPVIVQECPPEDRTKFLIGAVREMLAGGASTIGVLTRTEEDAAATHAEFERNGLTARVLLANKQDYEGGVSVLPVFLAKGLEFDAVIVTDADESRYQSDDAKLLYVACTRALHELRIHYSGKRSNLLKEPALKT